MSEPTSEVGVTPSTLRTFVGAGTKVTDGALSALIGTARDVLEEYVKNVDIPASVYNRAHMLVAAEMFHQDKAPNGVLNQQYDLGDGTISSTPIRIGADPLRSARSLLSTWIIPAVG